MRAAEAILLAFISISLTILAYYLLLPAFLGYTRSISIEQAKANLLRFSYIIDSGLGSLSIERDLKPIEVMFDVTIRVFNKEETIYEHGYSISLHGLEYNEGGFSGRAFSIIKGDKRPYSSNPGVYTAIYSLVQEGKQRLILVPKLVIVNGSGELFGYNNYRINIIVPVFKFLGKGLIPKGSIVRVTSNSSSPTIVTLIGSRVKVEVKLTFKGLTEIGEEPLQGIVKAEGEEPGIITIEYIYRYIYFNY